MEPELIRKLMSNDRDKIINILYRTSHFSDEEIKVATELIDIYLGDREQKDYIIYVYESDGAVAGYICYGKRQLTEWTYDLYWIAVDPDIQGKGIGSRLVNHMENDLKSRGGRIVLVETSGRKEYENERMFYSKNGYEVQTVIRDFYRSGDDLYVFRKYI